ncbi:MAG: metal ABC transporter ATP-binding protein [Gemmatimonadales bacterium]
MKPELVRFTNATLGYGRLVVLRDITFTIPQGDFLGLVGPNGSGKTTIVRALLGTHPPLAGTVTVAPGLRYGYVPQRDQVDYDYPLTALDVVLMGRYDRIGLGKRPGKADRDAAMQALVQVGIPDLAGRRLRELSGGQRQRTLVARALAGQPNMLVLDEPTNGLDLVSTTEVLGLIRDLHERSGITVLMVSHALNEVANYVERIALVSGIEQPFRIGTVDEIMNERVLSGIYGIPVEVSAFEGHRVVIARRQRRA